MPNAFLIGRRVQLRPIEESDAVTYTEWMNDPDMRNFLSVRFPLSLKDEKDWISQLSGRGTPRNLAFAIERRSDNQLIGTVGMHQIEWIARRAATGSYICPASLRGKGYGTEAKTLLIDYAFGELGLHSLWAIAVDGNVASIRALEKQGYKRKGVFREASLVKGVWRDLIYFDILHEEWEGMRRPSATHAKPRVVRSGTGRGKK